MPHTYVGYPEALSRSYKFDRINWYVTSSPKGEGVKIIIIILYNILVWGVKDEITSQFQKKRGKTYLGPFSQLPLLRWVRIDKTFSKHRKWIHWHIDYEYIRLVFIIMKYLFNRIKYSFMFISKTFRPNDLQSRSLMFTCSRGNNFFPFKENF